MIADWASKAISIRRTASPDEREAALALARRAISAGDDHWAIAWFYLTLGMAEYRSGDYSGAEKTLNEAVMRLQALALAADIAAFYRSMALFRLGKEAEAKRLAAETAGRMKPLPSDEANPYAEGANFNSLVLWMAYKEAREVVGLEADPVSQAPPPQGTTNGSSKAP
jgi:hypothetical protein